MRPHLTLVATALLALSATSAFAQQFTAGDIVVEKPWARATPKGAAVGAGYMTIRNHGAAPDTLIGGSADFADAVQVHEMSMKGSVMTMRLLPDGLTIPAHGAATLSPGGYHLMFQGLKRAFVKGETLKASLTFAHSGTVAIDLPVAAIGATTAGGAKPAADTMKGMKMD